MAIDNYLFPVPFASKAGEPFINSITATNETTYPNKATYEVGFPAITMQDIAEGGLPPFGQDFNGILNAITVALRYVQSGQLPLFDVNFASQIGGYPLGAVVVGTDLKVYQSTVDANTSDPAEGVGWELYGGLPLTGGTLTGNLTIKKATPILDILNSSGVGWELTTEENGTCAISYKTTNGSVSSKIGYDPTTNILAFRNISGLTSNGNALLITGSYGLGNPNLYQLNSISDTLASSVQRTSFVASQSSAVPQSISNTWPDYNFSGVVIPYRTSGGAALIHRLLFTPKGNDSSLGVPKLLIQQGDRNGFTAPIEVITSDNINQYQSGLGYGQSYHDYSSTSSNPKSWNVAYTNTTGAPMIVIIAMGSDDGNATLNILVDGVNVAYTNSRTSWNNVVDLTFPVSPGSTYTAVCSDSSRNIVRWTEYSN